MRVAQAQREEVRCVHQRVRQAVRQAQWRACSSVWQVAAGFTGDRRLMAEKRGVAAAQARSDARAW